MIMEKEKEIDSRKTGATIVQHMGYYKRMHGKIKKQNY